MQDVRGGRGAGICDEDGLHSYDERATEGHGAADGRSGENHARVNCAINEE